MRVQGRQTLPLIVIADEDEEERCLLRAILKMKGFKVVEAADGQEAINVAMEELPDLILIDLNLPLVSGSTVIRWLRKQTDLRDAPIVSVALPNSTLRGKRGLTSGSTAHLEKPVKFDQLDAVINHLLPGPRLQVAQV